MECYLIFPLILATSKLPSLIFVILYLLSDTLYMTLANLYFLSDFSVMPPLSQFCLNKTFKEFFSVITLHQSSEDLCVCCLETIKYRARKLLLITSWHQPLTLWTHPHLGSCNKVQTTVWMNYYCQAQPKLQAPSVGWALIPAFPFPTGEVFRLPQYEAPAVL